MSDGTSAGTKVVFESTDSPHSFREINSQLFFAIGSKLYQLDINSAVVNEVFDLLGSIEQLKVFQNKLFLNFLFDKNSKNGLSAIKPGTTNISHPVASIKFLLISQILVFLLYLI